MKTKRKSFFKSVIALTLALIMVLGAAPLSELAGVDWASFFAPKAEAAGKTDIIDYEVLKAQYIAGTKDYPESATVTGNTANDIYNYYIKDDIYSPSLDILNSVREDKVLKAEMVVWEMYSLGGSPSSAIDKIMKGEDYCETLLLSALEKSLEDNNWTKALKSEVAGETKDLRDMFYDLCDVGDEITTAEDAKKAEEGLKQAVKKLYPDKTEKITGAIGDIIEYTKRITEIIQKVVAYSKLLDIDEYSKEWLAEMRLMNEQTVNDSDMRVALDRLVKASSSEGNFANVSLMLGVETTVKWILETGIKEGIKALCKGDRVVFAIFTGLSVGKTICNIFFATDDVCEQLYVMNKLETLQLLARGVARKAESNFVNTENNYYAQIFTKSVDLYFNLITEVDCDCMKEFLKNLYTGGYLKGVLVWLYNAKGDYESAVETLDSFQQTRRNNYNYMIKYCMIGLKLTSEQSYNYYFGNEAVEMTNDAWVISSPYFTLALRDGSPKYIEITGLKDKSLSYINIPSKIGKYPVTKIADGVFAGNENINSAVIGNNVRTIGENAFNGCTNLKSVTIGDNVISIGSEAFQNCISLTSIIIPDGVTSIGDSAFSGCESLTSITIPDGVTNIGDLAFFGCRSLTGITIPDSVTHLGNSVFHSCINLTSVDIGNGVTRIGESAFTACNSLISITIPDSVTSIEGNAFADCYSLRSVNIPYGVTYIGSYAFASCWSLTDITIPGSVERIEPWLFQDCERLDLIVLENGVKYIDEEALCFAGVNLTIDIPDSVIEINENAFHLCTGLYAINVGKGNKNYSSKDGVLFNKDQTKIIQYPAMNYRYEYTIPDSVTDIAKNAFVNCQNLDKIVLHKKMTSLEKDIFDDSGIESVEITCPQIQKTFKGCDDFEHVIIGDGVETIEDSAFSGLNNIKSVVISDGVISVGPRAFKSCKGLNDVTIGNGVTSIGDYAFQYCENLMNIKIPDNVTSIGDGAFWGCTNLKSATISNNVTSIGYSVFSDCAGLTSIKIPESVTSIGSWAFGRCTGLTNITIPNSVASIGYSAFYGCTGLISIIIPNSVTSIGDSAFSGCKSLKNVTIPDSITSIGDSVFWGCNGLEGITIPDSVTIIEDSAFRGCTGLTSITIPVSITRIGEAAFSNCTGITETYYPGTEKQWKKISIGANNAPLTNYVIYEYNVEKPYYGSGTCGKNLSWKLYTDGTLAISGTGAMDNFTSLSNSPWYNLRSKIKSINIPKGVASIGNYAFCDCYNLTSLIIPDSVVAIGDFAFSGCASLTKVTVGNGVTSIGKSAFSGCTGLTDIIIPDSVTTIGDSAFLGCTSLIKATVGNGVTSIGKSAFSGCTGLTDIIIPDNVVDIGDSAFSGCTGLTKVTVGNGVTSIGNFAFSVCEGLTSIAIPDSVISIGGCAFYDCKNLESITIGNGVTNIGENAFEGCASLTNIAIPNSVTSIGDEAFVRCARLKSITVDDNNKKYSSKDGVLFNKDKTVIIQCPAGNQRTAYMMPDGVIIIGEKAFYECTSLISITIPNSVKRIGSWAFYGCAGLTSITIPGSVTSINFGAFQVCNNLTSITIPKSVTNIEDEAFYACNRLTDVYYSGTEAEWKKISIDVLNDELKNATIHYNANPCTNHSWSEWTVIQPATAEAEGLRERTCLVCGEKETEVIPKLDFIYGDVNGDGKINGRDAIKLAKYLAAYDEDKGESSVAVSPGADVNGDGKINGRDLVKLRKYLANYDESTGQSSVKLGPSH